MEKEHLNKGNITLNGNTYDFETYVPKNSSKSNGLWRMLRIKDIRGNEIITIYNVLKDSLRNIIITSLRQRNLLSNA